MYWKLFIYYILFLVISKRILYKIFYVRKILLLEEQTELNNALRC